MSTEKINPYDRIQLVMDHFDLNTNSFANRIGLKRTQNLYDLRDGKVKKISINLANKIIAEFSVINRDWLLDGIGEMLLENSKSLVNEEKNTHLETEFDYKILADERLKTINQLDKYIGRLEKDISNLEIENNNLKKENKRLLSLQAVAKH